MNCNILKCTNNNNSRTCPVLLCNYNKHTQQNKDILNRNFPDKNITLIKNIRPGFDICKTHIDLHIHNNDIKNSLINKITCFDNIKSTFNPGKAIGIDFLKNIDIDTHLKNIDMKYSHCPKNKYQKKYRKATHFENNTQRLPLNYKSLCKKPSYRKNCIQKNNFAQCTSYINNRYPILTQDRLSPNIHSKLCIGPHRINHTCENIWNNITSRKNII